MYCVKSPLFFVSAFIFTVFSLNAAERPLGRAAEEAPNFVLCMTDDQGWGDVAYNGHPDLHTPVLDEMAATGLRFNRFYTAAPVCSPARCGFLLGRTPARTGSFNYGWSMRPEELTIAEVLKEQGYATAHYGKWHVGTVKPISPVSPAAQGNDEYLAHDNFFDLNPSLSLNGEDPVEFPGESSIILAEHAVAFMRRAVQEEKPFLVVVWFGSPHTPYQGAEEDLAHYSGISDNRDKNYYAEITGIDRAMGMIRDTLRDLNVAGNTFLLFTSDNGPEGSGSSGGLRSGKHNIWEGGIRVPGIIEWPDRITSPRQTDIPAATLDLFPTLLELVGLKPPQDHPLDGMSIVNIIDGNTETREKPLGFWKYPRGDENNNDPWLPADQQSGWWRDFQNYQHPVITDNFGGHAAWVDNNWKLHRINGNFQLYNLETDPDESDNVLSANQELADSLSAQLEAWQRSVELSLSGADFPVGEVVTDVEKNLSGSNRLNDVRVSLEERRIVFDPGRLAGIDLDITVADIRGNEIIRKQLVAAEMTWWDLSHVPAGIYTVSIASINDSVHLKLVLK